MSDTTTHPITDTTLPSPRFPWNRLVQGLALALVAATLVVAYVLVTRPAAVAEPPTVATQGSAVGTCSWARDLPATWLPSIGAEPACAVVPQPSGSELGPLRAQ